VESWAWDFGDATTDTGAEVEHAFPADGEYQVTLTVTDSSDQEGAAFADLTLTSAEVPASSHVVLVSIDGLASSALETLGSAVPARQRLVAEGTATLDARTVYEETRTMPGHASMFTGRHVGGAGGHGVDFNQDDGSTVHAAAGAYVAGIFDVVHDNGGSTRMYSSKGKMAFFDRSWNGLNGAVDVSG